jgi:hypothetical protein
MSDNVILLGAGASADAGIPMMNSFMDVMWRIAKLGKWNGHTINANDRTVLVEALKVREELDGYHGRVALDVWNIEDILSVLSFNALAGGKREKERLRGMTKAIGRVIEITNLVEHDGNLTEDRKVGMYPNFWRALVNWSVDHNAPIPPILTFNYDLVLERALLNALVGKYYRTHGRSFPYDAIEIRYSTDNFQPEALLAKTAYWRSDAQFHQGDPGMILEEKPAGYELDAEKLMRIELLKLHGSVNFPRTSEAERRDLRPTQRLIRPLDDPLILPPVFNKATNSIGKDVWSRAMQLLRTCKNLIVCGYSLPVTDIYMQYFLKAALGPNQDLNHVYVFDPSLFGNERHAEGEGLRQRYARNFSEPIQRRIEFQPWCPEGWKEGHGTMRHLVWLLAQHPDVLLFG